jgi:lipoyl(octanoyl) transferase
MKELWVVDLGLVPYANALELQREVARRRIADEIDQDVLLLVEHPPVVTLGRTAKQANLIASPEFLASRGVELFEVERGGDITFHGPGQLVGYPIIDLKRHRKDLHWYLRQVEGALIDAVAEFGLTGQRVERYTGVWVAIVGSGNGHAGPRKIASIGVHARDWVTWHGFALNVNTDLRYFELIVPCGISDVTMTSVARELGAEAVDARAVADAVVRAFGRTFGLTPRSVDRATIDMVAGSQLDAVHPSPR